jgi:integrase
MRGSIRKRGEDRFLLVLEFGYQPDPATGRPKRIQKYETFRGTLREAETRLNKLVREVQDGSYIEPDKRTVGQWLDEWVDLAIKPPFKTQRAYDTYKSVIALHLRPSLGHYRVQALRAIHIEAFLASKAKLAPATLEKIFVVLSSALKAAERNRLVGRNEAAFVSNKPHAPEQSAADRNCWTAEDAASFLVAAKAAGPQAAALWTLALDSGMRKSELAGLVWTDVDLPAGRVHVRQQLLKHTDDGPVFIPTKGKRVRWLDIAPETVELLKTHRGHQAAIKMRFRQAYQDHGLVFAKQPTASGRRKADVLGAPLQVNNIADREFAVLIAASGVPRISIHGLRHTSASLLLAAGVPANVVQRRLGHKDVSTTLDVYAHVLPGQEREATRKLAALLHRK